LVRSDQPALDLADTGIGTFQKKINQLINFFEQEIEKKKREVEGVSSRSESLIIGPAPPIPIEERMDPAENQRSIAQIRSLIKEGKKREAMPLIETVCNSFQVYQRLWDEGNQDKRSFMEEKDSMHPLVENFLIDFFSSEAMRAEHANTRVLELGPGIGNDALNWLKYMPNLKQYLGLEASERAANIARARIKSLLVAREPGDIAPGWSIEVGDFVKRIQGVAQGMEQMGGRMSDVTTVITSISTLHYFWQPVFREILRSIHEILFHSRGYLVMALKTPDSASFKEHDLVESSRGYKVGIHKTEGILRAFMTPEEINKMLNEKGYEVIIAFPKVVEGYDRPGDREVFWCVIAKPKKITRKA
ncbi:class I SAM-dependent methyltransferase, partial [Candidatus Pacearchaeota archaeon]|nr:class I SAM-dependent methyltransferase [Candidatus Pacearchaeota archaeon]